MKKQNEKLIRDKIPQIAKSNGSDIDFRVADSSEYWEFLKRKLKEECNEYLESEELEELADILEVIDAIVFHKSIDLNQLQALKFKKHKKRGGFKKRFIMKGVS